MNNYSEKEIDYLKKNWFIGDKQTLKEKITDQINDLRCVLEKNITDVGVGECDLLDFILNKAVDDYFYKREDEAKLDFNMDKDGGFLTYELGLLFYNESGVSCYYIGLIKRNSIVFEDHSKEDSADDLDLDDWSDEVVEYIALIPDLNSER